MDLVKEGIKMKTVLSFVYFFFMMDTFLAQAGIEYRKYFIARSKINSI